MNFPLSQNVTIAARENLLNLTSIRPTFLLVMLVSLIGAPMVSADGDGQQSNPHVFSLSGPVTQGNGPSDPLPVPDPPGQPGTPSDPPAQPDDPPVPPVQPGDPTDPPAQPDDPPPGDGNHHGDRSAKFVYGLAGASGAAWLGYRLLPKVLPILLANPRLRLAAAGVSALAGFAGLWAMESIWKRGGLFPLPERSEDWIDDELGFGTPEGRGNPADDGTDPSTGMVDINQTETFPEQ